MYSSDIELAITFFSILTLLANMATLGLVGTAAAAGFGRHGRARTHEGETVPAAAERWWNALRRHLSPTGAVGLAWLIAAVSMSGSLYFSEGAGFTPCRLCWFQRGFMYPLVALLAVTAWAISRPAVASASRWLRRAGMTAALAGTAVATWHLLVERFPSLESAASCDPTTPCSLVWFERLGFITLPYMAFSGFTLIVTLLVFAGSGDLETSPDARPTKESTA